MNLMHHNKKTSAYFKLIDGMQDGGTTVTRRAKGYSDHNVIQILVGKKFLEGKQCGPRGGTRYFTTPAGKEAIEVLL
jgi:hypothetical protein